MGRTFETAKSFNSKRLNNLIAGMFLGGLLVLAGATGLAAPMDGTQLKAVQIGNAPFQMLLVAKKGQAGKAALKAYVNTLASSPELAKFVGDFNSLQGTTLSIRALTAKTSPRFLLLANSETDLSDPNSKLYKMSEKLTAAGAEVLVLPVALLASVDPLEREAVSKQILDQVDAVVAMDGGDLSPKVYGRYNTHSLSINDTRDAWESSFIKAAIADQNTFLFGVGRGHHLMAVNMGMDVFQDIESFLKTPIAHNDSAHSLGLFQTTNNLLKLVLPEAANGIEVSSQHHQAVMPSQNDRLDTAAMSPDGVVEALELKNSKGLSVQFDPLKLDAETSNGFFKNLVEVVRQQSSAVSEKSCELLLTAN